MARDRGGAGKDQAERSAPNSVQRHSKGWVLIYKELKTSQKCGTSKLRLLYVFLILVM